MSATESDSEALIGDECHIVARSPGGPRYRALPPEEADAYENLLLLCRNDHKRVDDQSETFTEEILRLLKANHEAWVVRALDAAMDAGGTSGSSRHRITLLTNGSEVLNIVSAAHGYDFDHDVLNTEDERALVGCFLQSAQDWGDIWDDVGVGGHVDARSDITNQLKELRAHGFLVYGTSTIRSGQIGGAHLQALQVAVLRVLRETNPQVPLSHRAGMSVDGLAT